MLLKKLIDQSMMLLVLGMASSLALSKGYETGPFPKTIDEVIALTPDVPKVAPCADQWGADPSVTYCILPSYNTQTKDIFVDAYVFLDKNDPRFANEQLILERYMQFDQWPEFVKASGMDAIRDFKTSQLLFVKEEQDGSKVAAHFYEYTSKAPVLGSLNVKGTATYRVLKTPMEGAILSAEFQCTKDWDGKWELITPMPDGGNSKGTKGQDANIHIVDLPNEEGYLLIYRTRVRLSVGILVELSSEYVSNSLKSLLKGMFM